MTNILYEPFGINRHKEHFVDYLEVVILNDGTIEYAVPSHQEKLIAIACKKLSLSRDELNDLCPIEFYGDFITWLNMKSGAIPVWNNFYLGVPNEAQLKSLELLEQNKLYTGK